MSKKGFYVAGAVLLAVFAWFSLSAAKDSLTQYVDYEEARAATRMVQVAGALEKGSSAYLAQEEALLFTLRDTESTDTMRVRYHGVKPANFEDAISIVAIGHYESGRDEFVANKLLVKCPSKYQGAEVKTYS